MLKMKSIAWLMMTAMMLSLFTACSGNTGSGAATGNTASNNASADNASADTSAGETNASGKVTTIQVATSGSAQEMKIRSDTGDQFMAENSDIAIEWIDIGSDRVQKTLTLISSGEAPDVLYLNEMVYAFIVKDVLKPLNDLIENDPSFDEKAFYPSLMDVLTYDGKIYAFPQEVSPFVMYYNKELFEAAGVTLPTDNWTQEEFYEAAKALTNPDEKVYGYQHYSGWSDQHLGWIVRSGVEEIYRDNYTKINFDNPETLDALKFIQQMVLIDKVSPDPAEAQAMGKAWDSIFRNQKVAMTSAGLWMLPQYAADPLPFEWDVVKMPKGKNQMTKAGVLNWAISATTQHEAEAWKFLTYLVGPVGMKYVAESNMALPGSTDPESNQIIVDSGFPNNIQSFIDSAPLVNLDDSKSPKKVEIMTEMNAQIDLMMLGEKSAEDAQKDMVEKINAILAEE